MSTIPGHDCLQPNRATAIQRRLAALLARDEARHRPPVSLPGKPANSASSLKPEPPPTVRVGFGPQHLDLRSSRLTAEQPTPEDAFGPIHPRATPADELALRGAHRARVPQRHRNARSCGRELPM